MVLINSKAFNSIQNNLGFENDSEDTICTLPNTSPLYVPLNTLKFTNNLSEAVELLKSMKFLKAVYSEVYLSPTSLHPEPKVSCQKQVALTENQIAGLLLLKIRSSSDAI